MTAPARFRVRSRASSRRGRGRDWSVVDYGARPVRVAPAPDEAAARRWCAELNEAHAGGRAVRWAGGAFQVAGFSVGELL